MFSCLFWGGSYGPVFKLFSMLHSLASMSFRCCIIMFSCLCWGGSYGPVCGGVWFDSYGIECVGSWFGKVGAVLDMLCFSNCLLCLSLFFQSEYVGFLWSILFYVVSEVKFFFSLEGCPYAVNLFARFLSDLSFLAMDSVVSSFGLGPRLHGLHNVRWVWLFHWYGGLVSARGGWSRWS